MDTDREQRINLALPSSLAEAIAQMASEENRKLPDQARHLLQEAIKAKAAKENDSIGDKIDGLYAKIDVLTIEMKLVKSLLQQQ